MLPNAHSNREVNVKRKSRARPIEINIPICIDDYNCKMDFVDKTDQVLHYYILNRKTIRWCKKLTMHLIQVRVLCTGNLQLYEKKESNLFRFLLFYHKKNSLLIVNYCSVPKNGPNYVDSQSHKKSL